MSNFKTKKKLNDFMWLVEEMNNTPEQVSKVLIENNIDEKKVEDKGIAIANDLINQLREKERSKIISINKWKTLAVAAVVIGIVALASIFFINKEMHNGSIAANRNINTKKSINTDTTYLRNSTKEERKITDKQENNRSKTTNETNFYVINPSKRDVLFEDNFEMEKASDNSIRDLRKAFSSYNDQDYKSALLALYEVESLQTMGSEENKELKLFYIHFYKALSYIAIDKPAKAVNSLQAAITASPDKSWKSKAQWYLALTYLKIGDTKRTVKLLDTLANTQKSGPYRNKAMNLLEEIKK